MTLSTLPMPAPYATTRYALNTLGTETQKNTSGQGRPHNEAPMQRILSKSEAHREFSCPEANRQKVCALLWAAFPGASAHQVQQRAALALGKDPRTIRYWMDGATSPRWHEIAIISGFVGFEKAMKILYGAGD